MFAAATVFAYGCSDNFDDSALWKDIDGMYKSLNELKAQVTTMQQQLDALAAVVSGVAVTSITQDADGHYVLSYKDADNVEHTIDIATMDDANTQPIIGMKADGEIYYWTVTSGGKTSWLLDTDGAKIPVTGRTPEIGVDDQGYWTLFGKRITDASGNPVKAEGKSASVITKVEMKDDGTVVFTLGDGAGAERLQRAAERRTPDRSARRRAAARDHLYARGRDRNFGADRREGRRTRGQTR